MSWSKEEMASEVINMLSDGATLNLGIGMPTLVAELMPPTKNIMIQSENGVMGVGERPTAETVSPTLINAGKETITVNKGASFFDSALSFGMIRGGHIDYCILGGMEVDVAGNLANWMVPGQKITGMGGAMDLVNGAKQVIIMMSHFNKNGTSKLVYKCQLPLTGTSVVNIVITELGIFAPAVDKFRVLKLAQGITKESLGGDALYV
ncbi:MAG: succinyl-CoA--3-ketoacid-CoA transferase [Bdellovibrionales bacterium GWA2_49_15]|nr:MAG: succinyl-CoA--3-ketoacid-CoA transferase [Bdellovibrionales bacterium GWA2_49_15]HAZ12471.1 succinyl-CoA--3-ketoacid-CoA transferase [Bdellovibrionales bacterium]